MDLGLIVTIAAGIAAIIFGLQQFYSNLVKKNIELEKRLGSLEARQSVSDNKVNNLENKIISIDRRLESIDANMITQGNNIVKMLTILDSHKGGINVSATSH